jgi:hypothetical protein
MIIAALQLRINLDQGGAAYPRVRGKSMRTERPPARSRGEGAEHASRARRRRTRHPRFHNGGRSGSRNRLNRAVLLISLPLVVLAFVVIVALGFLDTSKSGADDVNGDNAVQSAPAF